MSNYFLNSESIFEVIGNYPVVDQFDVLYSNLQTGSYLDNYVTGSLLKIATSSLNKIAFTTGERGSVFSKLGVPATSLPTQDLNTSYQYQPLRERAGVIRNVKIFSDSERFYDSLLPDLSQMVSVYGGTILGVYNSTYNIRGLSLDISQSGSNPLRGFLYEFPFSPKFSEVKRLTVFSRGFKASSGVTDIISDKLLLDYNNDIINTYNRGAQYVNNYLVDYSPDYVNGITPYNYAANASDISKAIFGFGDFNGLKAMIDDTSVSDDTGYTHQPYFRSGSTYTNVAARVCSPVIRGWKYGIHDGNPHYTSCVFRRDRFGQFRDMLEQRLEPVSYFDPENSPSRLFDAAEGKPLPVTQLTPQKLSIERPVEVNFVQISLDKQNKLYYSKIDPNLTRSSNVSAYATSSLPFFDLTNNEIGKNRPIIPDSLLTSVEILSAEI